MFHPRLMGSKKVTSLTALEQVVWRDLILIADDFGVLIDRVAVLQGPDKFLAGIPADEVGRAMRNVVKVGLFLAFEHQEEGFLCDPTWQTFQKIKYPRRTFLPLPGPAVLARCDEPTVKHYAAFHPLRSEVTVSEFFRKFLKSRQKTRDPQPTLPLSNTRLMANGKRLTADEEEGGLGEGPSLEDGFREFYQEYPRKEAPDRARKAYASARRRASHEAILAGLRAQLPTLQACERRFQPHPATWLNDGRWANEVAQPERPMGAMTRANVSTLQQFIEREQGGRPGPGPEPQAHRLGR